MEFGMRPIGEIHSPFVDKHETLIQPSRSTARGQVEVYPAYVAGLRDLDGFSHIILLYAFHRSDDYTLLVKPFLDDEERGLFATRYPARPNPIGLSIVRLLSVHDDILEIGGVDVLDGTSLFDIKPLTDPEENTDRWAVDNNFVALTPLRINLTDEAWLQQLVENELLDQRPV